VVRGAARSARTRSVNTLLELVAALIAVDFASGLVHWAEDTFGTETTPILGPWIVVPNVLHHRDPAAFVAKSWLAGSWDLALCGVILVALALAGGWFGPGVALIAVVGGNANQLHKWAHAPARAPWIVRGLWRTGLQQTPRQHARHHVGQKNGAYCVVTPFVNALLDRVRFWRALERCVVPLTGAPRREDLRAIRRWPRRHAPG
jgi:ubiquitin-conjugating enzyme E2 variant